MSRKSIRGTAEVAGLGPTSVYGKIDFIHRQCVGFAAERERTLPERRLPPVTLCVDRQDYMVNGRSRRARKNVQFSANCTVEARTGYVLGHHPNYDPEADPVEVEDRATLHGDRDPARPSYHRADPHLWLQDEFVRMAGLSPHLVRPDLDAEAMDVDARVRETEELEAERGDPERADLPGRRQPAPAQRGDDAPRLHRLRPCAPDGPPHGGRARAMADFG